jgi:hypothetical protein
MRRINTSTLQFEEFLGSHKPPYAILSHTWGKQEVTYDQMLNPSQETRRKAGYHKIEGCCGMAKDFGLSYAWVDSACIDKRSSAELSEAINSIYRWYRDAEVCFVYLVDVNPVSIDGQEHGSADQIQDFKGSSWFSRGWTLQELIAPRKRLFLSEDWSPIHFSTDGKEDSPDEVIATVTGISLGVLQHREKLSKLCVAERMSWASRRETTREEDIAYCLMGIFNVNMAIIYGEGSRKAFRRLQEEIMKNSFDYSILLGLLDTRKVVFWRNHLRLCGHAKTWTLEPIYAHPVRDDEFGAVSQTEPQPPRASEEGLCDPTSFYSSSTTGRH